MCIRDSLYTVVNSRAYEAENLNPGMAKWKVILIGADVVAALLIVGLEYTAIKNYKKRMEREFGLDFFLFFLALLVVLDGGVLPVSYTHLRSHSYTFPLWCFFLYDKSME